MAQNKKKTINDDWSEIPAATPLPRQQHRLSTASVQLGYAPSRQDRGGRELTNAGHAALFVSKTVAGCATLEKLLGRKKKSGICSNGCERHKRTHDQDKSTTTLDDGCLTPIKRLSAPRARREQPRQPRASDRGRPCDLQAPKLNHHQETKSTYARDFCRPRAMTMLYAGRQHCCLLTRGGRDCKV